MYIILIRLSGWVLGPETRAMCGNAACTDLCGGCQVTGIPTATTSGELIEAATLSKMETVQMEKERQITRAIEVYNSDLSGGIAADFDTFPPNKL